MVWANRKHLGCRYPTEVERAAGPAAMAAAAEVDTVRWT